MIIINNENYFTQQEVAEKFNVNVETVARWRRNGEITSFQLNKRKHIYSEKQIEEYIKRGLE